MGPRAYGPSTVRAWYKRKGNSIALIHFIACHEQLVFLVECTVAKFGVVGKVLKSDPAVKGLDSAFIICSVKINKM